MQLNYMCSPTVSVYSIDAPYGVEKWVQKRERRLPRIPKVEIEQIVDFIERNRNAFTAHECTYLDSLIDKYESDRTQEARQELKTFLIYMRRCVHPTPRRPSSSSSSDDSAVSTYDDSDTTSNGSDPNVTVMPLQKGGLGYVPRKASQNHLSAMRHRVQHDLKEQLIPVILTDTPCGRPRPPLCPARKTPDLCSCLQCARAKRIATTTSSSSTESSSVVQNTLKALKNVFGREKSKQIR